MDTIIFNQINKGMGDAELGQKDAEDILQAVTYAGRDTAKAAINKLGKQRISTESLTFLFSISIGLISTLLDVDEPYKTIGNACFGGSCAFFAPIIIKRIMAEGDDDPDAMLPYVLENVFIPVGLVLTVAGVDVLCLAVEFNSGMAVTIVGFCTTFIYSLSLAVTAIFGNNTDNKVKDGK